MLFKWLRKLGCEYCKKQLAIQEKETAYWKEKALNYRRPHGL